MTISYFIFITYPGLSPPTAVV